MSEMKLNRWKGLAVGLVGGIVGVLSMRHYRRELAPRWFAESPRTGEEHDLIDEFVSQLPEIEPQWGRQYRDGETPEAAAGRILYTRIYGEEPASAETRALLQDVVLLGWGALVGMAYGFTRTTTRARDIAGGFFFGLRLFLGWSLLYPWLGLREQPRTTSRYVYFISLTAHWVYSFITANVTRLLYRFFSA